jgi:hypothetical protein
MYQRLQKEYDIMELMSAQEAHENTSQAIFKNMDERMAPIMEKIHEACDSCRYTVTAGYDELDADMCRLLIKAGYKVTYFHRDESYIIEW